jgi:nucleoid-associated protein YgaU
MNKMYIWAIGVSLLVALTTGCKQNEDKEVTVAPDQHRQPSGPAYPEPPIDQPKAQANDTYTPPVDTTPIPPEDRPAKSGNHTAKSSGGKASKSSGAHQAAPRNSYAKKSTGSKTYTVKKGDTLQEISQKMYGTTRHWRKIYNANKGVIKGGSDKIKPGMKLTIPK